MTAARTGSLFVLAVAAGVVAGQLLGGPGTITLIGLSALALLVSAFLPSGGKAEAIARPPEPGPPRRRPIVPPPTRGRWDEAPRA